MTPANDRILVWDPLVRICHWLLLAAFVTSYLTGEEETDLHFYSGYLILLLIATRIAWGFMGSEHARFANFNASPTAAIGYVRGLVSGTAKHYVGHNPAAAVMAFALLLCVLGTAGAGLILHGYHGEGPLAFLRPVATESAATTGAPAAALGERRERHDDDDDEEEHEREHGEHASNGPFAEAGEREGRPRVSPELRQRFRFWKETHEIFANLTLLLVFLHAAGVAASSLRHRENLVKSMIDGYKRGEADLTTE